MRATTLWTAILLTWGSATPDALVLLQRRQPPATQWRQVATVPGQHYLDYKVVAGGTYCYRARFNLGNAPWTPEVCINLAETSAGSLGRLAPPPD